MSSKSPRSSRVGAEEALDTLVAQFADPMVFLRELVQNSLDAASTQVDVTFDYDADPGGGKSGLLRIGVADNGEGMNEGIIDKYLLTLFSSTKENDLTKIGKFGVGFVSIFAMEPQLVTVETGQAGESWRILFHADRSFEKLRLEEPIEGTTVTLYKQVTGKQVGKLKKRARDTVSYWCKYAEADILVDGDPVGEEFGIDAALSLTHQEPGTDVALGFAPLREPRADGWLLATGADAARATRPLIGFYNRGLTLVEGELMPDDTSSDLAGLSMRVKSRYLEHTLTRDNVRADESYHKAIAIVRAQVDNQLHPRLVAHLEALARHSSGHGGGDDPGAPPTENALLYARLPSMRLHQTAARAAIFPTTDGPPISLHDLRRQDSPTGDVVPVAPESTPLTRLFADRGTQVVLDTGGIAEHLRACDLRCSGFHSMFYTAERVEAPEAAVAMLDLVRELLDKGKARVRRCVFGDLDYAGSAVAHQLFARQEEAFGLTTPGDDDAPTLFGGARDVVFAWKHPLVARCVQLAEAQPALAAHLLAQGVLMTEDSEVDRRVDVARAALRAQISRATRTGDEA